MDKINQYSFAMNEANLFLDTHPFDSEALNYFEKHRDLRVEAVKEYAKYYAPLAIDYAVCDKTPWSWVNEPWPWEGVEC
jgi:spore coat protein JB